jgi:hypothetical protein
VGDVIVKGLLLLLARGDELKLKYIIASANEVEETYCVRGDICGDEGAERDGWGLIRGLGIKLELVDGHI